MLYIRFTTTTIYRIENGTTANRLGKREKLQRFVIHTIDKSAQIGLHRLIAIFRYVDSSHKYLLGYGKIRILLKELQLISYTLFSLLDCSIINLFFSYTVVHYWFISGSLFVVPEFLADRRLRNAGLQYYEHWRRRQTASGSERRDKRHCGTYRDI